MVLSEPLIEAFNTEGFVRIESLIDRKQVEEILIDYNRAVSGEIPVPDWGKDHVPGKLVQLANPTSVITHWRQHPYFLNALNIARQLMGPDIDFAYDQIILKPAQYPAITPWHQDAGYWRKGNGYDRGITCWLALSETTVENGCMHFIPGSHKAEVLAHEDVSDKSEINSALVAKVDESLAVPVALSAGDASFHHCRTLHYTGGNSTDQPRRGLITHFWPK